MKSKTMKLKGLLGVLYRHGCMIIFWDCVLCKCGNFLWVCWCICTFLSKRSLFCLRNMFYLYLHVLVGYKDLLRWLGLKTWKLWGHSKDIFTFSFILNSVLSFIMNLFLTEHIFIVMWMYLQWAPCCCRLLMSSLSGIFMTSKSVASRVWDI